MTPIEAPPLVRRPDARFMLAHPAHWVAQGFGSGLSPLVPGTMGTLLGWLSFVVLSARWPHIFTAQTWAIVIAASFVLGIWVCDKTGRDLGVSDHGSMVWDEIVAFWIVLLLLMPTDALTQLAAFVVFRFFDMLKPAPIDYFDRRLKGGFGVMFDDLVAAFYTLLVFAVWRMF
ncbi:MAG TPA: phosphatidylglycerophosphatase A [Noviherbaspirillum sp.]